MAVLKSLCVRVVYYIAFWYIANQYTDQRCQEKKSVSLSLVLCPRVLKIHCIPVFKYVNNLNLLRDLPLSNYTRRVVNCSVIKNVNIENLEGSRKT